MPQTNWCWAAASEAVLQYTGNAPGMCTIANFTRQQSGWGNDNCCANGTGAICNQGNVLWGSTGSVERVLGNWGAMSQRYGRSLTLKEVQDAIDDDSPMIIGWRWTAGGGHAVVLHGYSGSTITVMDPWSGPTSLSHGNLTSTSARAWTHTLVVEPRKVTYVVDDTGSMAGEINSVKSTLVDQVMGYQSDGTFVKYSLITYKDAVNYRGSTTDHNQIISWINGLGASGGDDCPEEGYGALDLAAMEAPDSDVWWMTDADSHGGFLRMLQTRVRLLLAGNTLHSTILGSCSGESSAVGQTASVSYPSAPLGDGETEAGADVNAFAAGEELSTATGGLFFAVASSDIADATEMIVEEISSTALVKRLSLPAGSHDTGVPVDESMEALRITLDVKAGATGTIEVADPTGGAVTAGSPGVEEIVAGNSRMLLVGPSALMVGEYTVSTSSDADYFFSASGDSPHSVEASGDTTTGVDWPLPLRVALDSLSPPTAPVGPGDAGPGGPLDPVTVTPPVYPFDPETLTFFVEKGDGSDRSFIELFDDGLHGDGDAGDGIFGGDVLFATSGNFRLGVTDFAFFERMARRVITVGDVVVSGGKEVVASPSSTIHHSFTVENLGASARSFEIGTSSSADWADLSGLPATVTLDPAESLELSVPVTIPAGTARGESSALTLTAVATDDPTIFDDAATRTVAWDGPLLQSLSSMVVSSMESVVLMGSGFGSDPGAGNRSTDTNNVTFAGFRVPEGDILAWSSSAITIRVPASSVSGLLFVVADGLESNSRELVVLGAGSGGGGAAIVDVPALSTYGMMLVILLIAIAGAALLRTSLP